MITHVAIKQDGQVYSLPKPMRHHNVIHMMCEECGFEMVDGEQGFLEECRLWPGENNEMYLFLTREEAFEVAFTCGQILDPDNTRGDTLFSEDLW